MRETPLLKEFDIDYNTAKGVGTSSQLDIRVIDYAKNSDAEFYEHVSAFPTVLYIEDGLVVSSSPGPETDFSKMRGFLQK